MYDQFGADASFVPKIVDYAYSNFNDWYPDPDYFHDSDYEEKIALLEKNLDDLADYIYEYGDSDGLVSDLEMDVDAIYHSVALDEKVRNEIAKKIVDRFYKS